MALPEVLAIMFWNIFIIQGTMERSLSALLAVFSYDEIDWQKDNLQNFEDVYLFEKVAIDFSPDSSRVQAHSQDICSCLKDEGLEVDWIIVMFDR